MNSNNYQVASGDSLFRISKVHGITIGELLAANPQLTPAHGRDPNLIYLGEYIVIPKPQFSEQSNVDQIVQKCSIQSEEEIKDEETKKFFIAIADRAVKGTLGAFYHYSVQYWQCYENVPLRSEISVTDLSSKHSSVIKIKSIELLRNADWEVWVYEKISMFSLEKIWKSDGVSISVVHFSDSSEDLLVLRQGLESEVKPIWDNLESSAANYTYAEQGGENFSGVFTHWPNSKYQMPGNLPFNNVHFAPTKSCFLN